MVTTLLTCGNELVSCGNDFLTCGNDFLTCGNDFLTCGKELSTCGNELLTCGNEVLTCGHNFLSHGHEIEKCKENGSMSLPGLCIYPFLVSVLLTVFSLNVLYMLFVKFFIVSIISEEM